MLHSASQQEQTVTHRSYRVFGLNPPPAPPADYVVNREGITAIIGHAKALAAIPNSALRGALPNAGNHRCPRHGRRLNVLHSIISDRPMLIIALLDGTRGIGVHTPTQ